MLEDGFIIALLRGMDIDVMYYFSAQIPVCPDA